MNQVIQCECGETDVDFDRYCQKCKKYRGPTLNDILERMDSLKFDLQMLGMHLIRKGKI